MASNATRQLTSLVDDLLTNIENNPQSVVARKLLIEQYELLGWNDAAANEARSVMELFPTTTEATGLQNRYGPKTTTTAAATTAVKVTKKEKKKFNALYNIPAKPTKKPAADPDVDVQQLGVQYVVLQDDAKSLLRELSVLADLAPEIDLQDQIAELTALSDGCMSGAKGRGKDAAAIGSANATRSARAVAGSIKADTEGALDIAISDLEAVLDRNGTPLDTEAARDTAREGLRKRADAVKAALPADICHIPSDALMHVEHEKLQRTYHNTDTMLGDAVADIPRADFWVSSDGYAWDVDELVQAIQAAKGAMRNPLTKESFSTGDVAALIRHPKGAALAALEVEQKQLRQGVRTQTIDTLRSTAATLLADMSEDSAPSHRAVEAWELYLATLPRAEQQAIDKLRVAAVDTHSGLPFDDTVGDAVRDAKANRLCFHKAGDFLRQAAESLGKSTAGR